MAKRKAKKPKYNREQKRIKYLTCAYFVVILVATFTLGKSYSDLQQPNLQLRLLNSKELTNPVKLICSQTMEDKPNLEFIRSFTAYCQTTNCFAEQWK